MLFRSRVIVAAYLLQLYQNYSRPLGHINCGSPLRYFFRYFFKYPLGHPLGYPLRHPLGHLLGHSI